MSTNTELNVICTKLNSLYLKQKLNFKYKLIKFIIPIFVLISLVISVSYCILNLNLSDIIVMFPFLSGSPISLRKARIFRQPAGTPSDAGLDVDRKCTRHQGLSVSCTEWLKITEGV